MKTAELADRFLRYFEKRDHTIVPSASLVTDDPALLFTVAGMVPFIPYLSGVVPAPYPRAPTCRSASAPTTSKRSARRRATARSSRCSATGRSATTSRRARSRTRGSC